jgi:hypothetical protein
MAGVHKTPSQNGESNARVVKREAFSDASELIELEGGTILLRERRSANLEVMGEQPAPYHQPAPKPRKVA